MAQPNHPNYPWLELVYLPETDSTNNEVIRYSSSKEMTLVCTDFQSQGRGQRGNSWESELGQNLLFSFLIYPDYVAADEQFVLSQAVSLAIQQTLSLILPADELSIKWPNDIYWKDKKLGGILIENSLVGNRIERSVLGIGLNVNQRVFTSDAPNPVSLRQITGQPFDRMQLLLKIAGQFRCYLDMLKRGDREPVAHAYFGHLYRKQGFHLFRDAVGEFEACIREVERTGHLVLADRTGRVRKYAFKEVGFVI
ncbi:MAG: biotin--[acetyl-CoA-carboxylase] ligase [Bacteroidaceae bacterium]|nr:biotin--[acetyl-CoA-carboxylase] ligase [Bacteroidaceae bacterium]